MIDYTLVSEGAILRDFIDPRYLNKEHKMLVDIADSFYNVDRDPDSFKAEYKELHDKYGEEFFDKVLDDMRALDSQLYNDNKVEELVADYEDRLGNSSYTEQRRRKMAVKRLKESYDFGSGEIDLANGLTSESAIADAIDDLFIECQADKNPSVTYYKELGWDDKNTYACVMTWCDEESAEYFGYENDSDFVLAKIAFNPRNSIMSEYDIDWLMPYDDKGNVWDTQIEIASWNDADWLANEWLNFVKTYNSQFDYEQVVDEGCYGKKKKKKSKKVLNQKKSVCGEDAKRTKGDILSIGKVV